MSATPQRDEHCTHPAQSWCDCDWCRCLRDRVALEQARALDQARIEVGDDHCGHAACGSLPFGRHAETCWKAVVPNDYPDGLSEFYRRCRDRQHKAYEAARLLTEAQAPPALVKKVEEFTHDAGNTGD